MKETLQPNVKKKVVMINQSVLCPPRSGTILAVKMPCGRKALACVLRNIYPTAWCGYGPSKAIALRVEWLSAQTEYIRGYKIVWGEILNSSEGTLPWPPDSAYTCYGTCQLGEYGVVYEPE